MRASPSLHDALRKPITTFEELERVIEDNIKAGGFRVFGGLPGLAEAIHQFTRYMRSSKVKEDWDFYTDLLPSVGSRSSHAFSFL